MQENNNTPQTFFRALANGRSVKHITSQSIFSFNKKGYLEEDGIQVKSMPSFDNPIAWEILERNHSPYSKSEYEKIARNLFDIQTWLGIEESERKEIINELTAFWNNTGLNHFVVEIKSKDMSVLGNTKYEYIEAKSYDKFPGYLWNSYSKVFSRNRLYSLGNEIIREGNGV